MTATTIWDLLTRPNPRIIDIKQRQQSRLMAGLLLALFVVSLTAALVLQYQALQTSGDIPLTVRSVLPLPVAIAILYLINRWGLYDLSSRLFVSIAFAVAHIYPILLGLSEWLFMATTIIILSATLLTLRLTVITFLASLAIQVLYRIYQPFTLELTNLSVMLFMVVNAPLLMVYIVHSLVPRTGTSY